MVGACLLLHAEVVDVYGMLTTDPFQVHKQDAKYSCDPFVMVLANYPAQLRWRHGFSITLGILPGDRDKAIKVRGQEHLQT
jgi:hypothetical protein